MINTAKYAEQIEEGLNYIIGASEDRELAEHYVFRVFADVGMFREAERRKRSNFSTVYINCILTASPSPNETIASGLVIAVEGFTLSVAVPLNRLKARREEAPESVIDGDYVFVEKVKGIINEYLKVNTIESITDDDGNTYACGYGYTMGRTGSVDLGTMIGEYINFDAYISVNIVQNGINSKDVVVEFDGEVVPYQAFSPNRSIISDGSTFSDGTGASKAIVSATTLAFNITLPAVLGTISSQFNDYLLNGRLNTLHFVRLKFGQSEEYSKYYCMTYGDISASVNGVLNAGLSINFTELAYIPEILTVPSYMTVKQVQIIDIGDSVTVQANGDCIVAFSDGYIVNMQAGDTITHAYSDKEVSYDDSENSYTAFITACPIDKTDARENLIDLL